MTIIRIVNGHDRTAIIDDRLLAALPVPLAAFGATLLPGGPSAAIEFADASRKGARATMTMILNELRPRGGRTTTGSSSTGKRHRARRELSGAFDRRAKRVLQRRGLCLIRGYQCRGSDVSPVNGSSRLAAAATPVEEVAV